MAPSVISLYSTQVEALHRARILPIVQLKNRVLSGQLVYLVLETCPEIGGHLLQKFQPCPYDFVLEDLLWWTMESLQKVIVISYFIYYQAYVPINIDISSYIYILLQMPIASNLSSEFRLLVFFQTPLGPPFWPIEKWRENSLHKGNFGGKSATLWLPMIIRFVATMFSL